MPTHDTPPVEDEHRSLLSHVVSTSYGMADSANDQASDPPGSTRSHEARVLLSYSLPLIVTSLLQYSINLSGIFTVGRLGRAELGAVSLANTTFIISCLAPFQGLATSLDTLCAQAYGSGQKHLVGLQCQRMLSFLFCLTVPLAVFWCASEHLLRRLVSDAETARLAGLYLKIAIASLPGIILFETGKRFVQAQGLFRATTYVLLIAAPANLLLSWLLVYRLRLGFVGAPIALAATQNLLGLLLILYVRFVDGSTCWGGLDHRAFSNWCIMIRLALPSMIMVEAEWFAFHAVTLFAGRFGTDYLAAQSVLMTLMTISFQLPFPLSIGASTRVANLIGGRRTEAAKMAAQVTFITAAVIGVANVTIFILLRSRLPLLFTKDEQVIAIVARTSPFVAVAQLFDSLGTGANGLLRGVGRQTVGGMAGLFAYYVVSLPVSLALAFGADWKLAGMWTGLAIGLSIVTVIEYSYLLRADWDKAASEAAKRNKAY
ncbi:MATE efflux family protein [Ophiocordyceps camponoti-floridani]|uniref:MATE efflux family protein n=1 Tax=Ophiocordyceps camponoti-floridani TaxID=2030778 RepID=A0A8H4VCX1_9HYPO|nr:MATE efflux family protein [Ophiocordyceps camponoti-floridani]